MKDPNTAHTYNKNNRDREHVTDGPCWCNPMRETVEPFDFNVAEPLPEAITGFELRSPTPDMVNVSGVEDEPLWVERSEIAAVGVFGKESSMVILRGSGFQLKAKEIHPNEIMGRMFGEELDDADPEGP